MENIPTPRAVPAPATLDIAATIAQMRASGRDNLIHYAGAAHRDRVAWHVCAAYLADPTASEGVLKSLALRSAHGWDVSPEQLSAAGGAS